MRETLRQGLQLIGRNQRKRWIILIALALLVSGFEMIGAVLVYVLLNLVVSPHGPIEIPLIGDARQYLGDMDENQLYVAVLTSVAVFFVVRAFARVGTKYAQARIAYNAGARLANRLVQGYLSMPYSRHLVRPSASLIRNGHQATLQLVTGVFIPMIRVTAESLLTLGLVAVMVAIAPAATAVAVVIMGGAAAALILFVQPKLKWIGKMSHRMSKATLSSLQQSLQGIRDIKVLGRERYFVEEYGRARLTLARMNYLRSAVGELPTVVMETALIAFVLIAFGFAVFAGSGAEEILSVVGLFAYVGMRLQPSLAQIIGGLNELKHSTAPLADIYRDLMEIEQLPSPPKDVSPLPFTNRLALENVTFQYENTHAPALESVDLVIRPGEQIGICGPTGGGKTTLVDIVAGLLEPTEGRVTVDGVDIAGRTREWQRNLGVVPQMVFLTDDTIRRNVALGVPDDQIDEEAVEEAIRLAQLDDFIASLPEGLDTTVGERGVRVSGGQRQRIAIARALYRRPAVLIFDEGTSALDNATEHQLMEAIERLRGNHTIILVAHRLSTVENSDRVIFVESGRIAGEGTYGSLYGDNESFRALARAQ